MKLICVLAVWYLYCVQVIDSGKFRLIFDDELYPYSIDKSVPNYEKYFSKDNLSLELIDDDTVKVGGYGLSINGMDPKLPLEFNLRTQYRDKSIWNEGMVRLFLPNFCPELVNPSRPWYNITKLWTNCPIQKGEKWIVETQIINVNIVLPPSIPIGPWKAYFLFSQGLFGGVTKFGTMVAIELVEVV